MGILSLSISFVVIALILIIFYVLIRKNENNVRYAITIVYPKDNVIPRHEVQSALLTMFGWGFIVLILTFALGLLLIHLVASVSLLLLHIILILPIILIALMFRARMNHLDKKYHK